MSKETRPSSEAEARKVLISQDYSVEHGYTIKLGDDKWFAHCKKEWEGTLGFQWKSGTHLDDVSQSLIVEQSLSRLSETVLGRSLDFENPAALSVYVNIKNEDEEFNPKSLPRYDVGWIRTKRRDYLAELSREGVHRREVKYTVEDLTIKDSNQRKFFIFKTKRDPFDTRMQLQLSSAVGLPEDVITWISDLNQHTLEDGEALAISSTLLQNFSAPK